MSVIDINEFKFHEILCFATTTTNNISDKVISLNSITLSNLRQKHRKERPPVLNKSIHITPMKYLSRAFFSIWYISIKDLNCLHHQKCFFAHSNQSLMNSPPLNAIYGNQSRTENRLCCHFAFCK